MTATIITNDPALHKHVYLDKVDTNAKAHTAVKADELTTAAADFQICPRLKRVKIPLVRQPKHTVVGSH
jgi:hypothetical protein